MGADLLEIAVPEVAEVVSFGKNCKTAAKSVGKQTLRKQIFTNISHQYYRVFFRYQLFVAVSGNLGGKIPVADDVFSSHKQKIYPTTSLDENFIEDEFQTDRNY